VDNLTNKQIIELNQINDDTEDMSLGEVIQSIIDAINAGVPGPQGEQGEQGERGRTGAKGEDGDPGLIEAESAPVNAKAASKKLTLSGVANDGETVTIGEEVYEMDADASVTEGNIPVDISGGTKTQATVKLSLSGVSKEEDTFTIGEEIYELDYDGNVTGDNIPVDLSGAASADYADGILTLTGNVTDGELVVINDITFELDTNNSITEGHIAVNIAGNVDKQSAAIALASVIEAEVGNLFNAEAAINIADWDVTVTSKIKGTHMNVATSTTCNNGSWGSGTLTGGVDASAADTAAEIISVFNAQTAYDITASADGATNIDFDADIAGDQDGSVGNSIISSEDLTNGSFSAATLTGGSDCTEAEAAAALISTIDAESEIVDASDGGANDVTVTAKVKSEDGNTISLAETMANGSWGGVALTGGADGTIGTGGQLIRTSDYLYLAIDDNTINDDNWRRMSLGTVY
jgi:hypothetical protein